MGRSKSCKGQNIHQNSRDNQADIVKRNIALAHIDEFYPDLAWNQIYTDGSGTNAVSNGGAGVVFKDINN